MSDQTEIEVVGTKVATREGSEVAPEMGMDIQSLMALAIEKDGAIEVIERLREMSNDEMARHAQREFQGAFAEFRRRCPTIPRNKRGAGFLTDAGVREYVYYAPIDTIQPIVDPILQDCGFHYRWSSKASESSVTTTCTLTHEGGHSESSSMTLPVSGPPKSSRTQAHSGTRSFAKRITLEDVLGLSVVDDVDGQDGGAGECIDEGQLDEIRSLVLRKDVDEAKLMEFADVAQWEDLEAAKHEMVVKLLKAKADK